MKALAVLLLSLVAATPASSPAVSVGQVPAVPVPNVAAQALDSIAALNSKRNTKVAKYAPKIPPSWSGWLSGLLGHDAVSPNCSRIDTLILYEASQQTQPFKGNIESHLHSTLHGSMPADNDVVYYLSAFQDKHTRNNTHYCYKEKVRGVRYLVPIADTIAYLPHIPDFSDYKANSLEAIINAVERTSVDSGQWGFDASREKLIVALVASAPKGPKDHDGHQKRRHRKWPGQYSSHDLERLCARYDYPPLRQVTSRLFGTKTYVAFLVLPSPHQQEVYNAYLKVVDKLYQNRDSVQKLSDPQDPKSWERAFHAMLESYRSQAC
eukprot:Protomagalhaensia_sp_Gyna_25__4219@NODE_383_length_3630_cov_191_540518_g294_i0_p1_GENE_NODE_383_length_3630_cov_191_540518_g294_i0NODE_383_length_3630_cov_191_540518_g294_i0_p1_ORF_typecomplete_len323_score43_04Integrin_beta/PF00362_18/0_0032MUG113/PF13455_6/2_3e03MUG113/PF13455_6/1_1_NODE_383_length_3630_cov_191_540518_g294_i025383506